MGKNLPRWRSSLADAVRIATQYILLLLVEMKSSCMLRLPYRAGEIVPPEVARLLPPRPAIWDSCDCQRNGG